MKQLRARPTTLAGEVSKSESLIRARLSERGGLIRADDLLDALKGLAGDGHSSRRVSASAIDLTDLNGLAFFAGHGPLAHNLCADLRVIVSSRDTFVGGRVVALFYLLFLAVTAADGEQRHQTDDGNVTHE